MSSDNYKLEKKSQKAQLKLEKKRLKAEIQGPIPENKVQTNNTQEPVKNNTKRVPWYKNPDWIRAVVGLASLIVAIIAVTITLLTI